MSVLDLFRLDGKIALVTGAKRGMGKAMAIALAEAGADIIGVSATLELRDSDVEREVQALGRQFTAYACDLSEREAVHHLIERVQASHPVIDILVNNAGTIFRKPAVEHPDASWDTVLGVNLSAPFLLSREMGKGMIERSHGKIIFTASLLTFQGGITVPSYAASKGAIGQLTKALANEWAGACRSMPSRQAILRPIILRRCARTRNGAPLSSLVFPLVAGENRRMCKVPLYFWPRRHPSM